MTFTKEYLIWPTRYEVLYNTSLSTEYKWIVATLVATCNNGGWMYLIFTIHVHVHPK